MARWMRLLLGRGLLDGKGLVSQRSFDELISKQMKVSKAADLGLGWGLVEWLEWRGHKLVSAAGGTFGFSSQVEFMPSQMLGYVFLCNARNTQRLAKEIGASIWENLVDRH